MNPLPPPAAISERQRQAARALDETVQAQLARANMGLSPVSMALAAADWAMHLALSPGRQMVLGQRALALAQQAWLAAARPQADDQGLPLPEKDARFRDESWQQWPFSALKEGFKARDAWWREAAQVDGLTRHHQHVVDFFTRQALDALSPSNWPATNAEAHHRARATGGTSLLAGYQNFTKDLQKHRHAPPDADPQTLEPLTFEVGKDVAATPGKVVFRNHLIELIQYTPTTPDVYAEPVLIVPSWIMKYYILDLSPHNSMVKYLVDQGHTVFILSWKNPTAADRDLGLEDYRWLGVMDALDAVTAIVPERKVQAVGYCLGGTLLTIAAAAMARDGDDRLHSLTLLASETDFRESGEIALFIDDSQLAWLEAGMWDKGYLDGKQMAASFQMLNSRDLIWSRRVREYLLGERQQFNDLMAWNADVTRMPYRMHSEYLRRLYLNNDLAEGRYQVGGRPVAIADIEAPMLIVGTVRDHVAPWPSVYKMHLLSDAELTFVLTSGGHNAGVVSEPGHPRRSYQIATRSVGARYVDPQTWRAETPLNEGSWWPAWQQWLARRSTGRVAPPAMSGTQPQLGDAPGTYVAMR